MLIILWVFDLIFIWIRLFNYYYKRSYDILFCADLDDGSVLNLSVKGDMDPGYGSTSKMIAESALCIVKDCLDLNGGIYTPAAAMGEKLISRLETNAGLTFSEEN